MSKKKFAKFYNLFEKSDKKLKEIAFTHSSYANEHKISSNEILEFLGDSVLSLCVSDYLYKNCPASEGKLSKIRSNFVCTDSLSKIAKEMELENNLKLGKSFKDKTISNAMLEDLVESMIAVVYLSNGFASTQTAVLEMLDLKSALKKGIKRRDYKTDLQEYCQKYKMKIEYVCSTYETKGGQTNFKSGIRINGEFYKYGTGSTKRESEQNAAMKTLKVLEEK